jgi:acyl carrier protein
MELLPRVGQPRATPVAINIAPDFRGFTAQKSRRPTAHFWESNNMTTENMKEEIRQFILSEFLPGEKAANLQDDTALRTSGILDSVATLRLVTFVEERFGIQVEAHEASVENFDRINSIAAFVESKKTGAS